jgi:2-dehydro-3-deoxygluconokinase
MVLCFGEVLIRLQPSFEQCAATLYPGGAETNVAASLSAWQVPVQLISALPKHAIGHALAQHLQNKGIDCSNMLWGGHRVGTYYLAGGGDIQSDAVVYDRQNSSFYDLRPGCINWDSLLNDITWLHCSAITPAIDVHHPALLEELLHAAKQRNIMVSIDLNYRPKLWQYCKLPAQYMRPLIKYCDVVMGNIWAAESLLGITAGIKDSAGKSPQQLIEAAQISMDELLLQWPQLQYLAYTFRLPETYFGILYCGNQMEVSRTYTMQNVIDKIGTGDSFMAGLIYGVTNSWLPRQTINFAAAAAVSKFGVPGDFNTTSVPAIQQIVSH